MSRSSLETAAAALATILCAAFIASFLFGLGGGGRVAVVHMPGPAQQEAPLRTVGRVEVLNASGRAGLARAATDRLRNAGFDVVYFGNAAAAAGDSSIVIDRIGNDAVARAAARQLSITPVHTRTDTTLFLDATVIIGKDWRSAPAEPAPEVHDSWRARVSRWLRPGR